MIGIAIAKIRFMSTPPITKRRSAATTTSASTMIGNDSRMSMNACTIMPKVERVIRAAALSIREMAYIDAARAAGFSSARIIFRHMAPNVAAPYLIMLTAYIAQAILLEASLSFLGLGVTEPTAAWGLMLSGNASDFYREAPWMILFPGLAISAAVFAFNLFGDSLRDWLDPKLKA